MKLKVVSLPTSVVKYWRHPAGGLEKSIVTYYRQMNHVTQSILIFNVKFSTKKYFLSNRCIYNVVLI